MISLSVLKQVAYIIVSCYNVKLAKVVFKLFRKPLKHTVTVIVTTLSQSLLHLLLILQQNLLYTLFIFMFKC